MSIFELKFHCENIGFAQFLIGEGDYCEFGPYDETIKFIDY